MKSFYYKVIFVSLSFLFLFLSCSKNKSKQNAVTKFPEYVSNYTPHHSEKMPVIKITSESGNTDFATKPKSQVVIDNGLMWGWIKQEELDNGIITTPEYEQCKITVEDENGQIELENIEAKIKVRGNWTTSYDKKPFRIKFSEKQSMLGLNDGKQFKNWTLAASYKDWSFMRDYSALYFSKLISKNYASDIRLVEVQINGQYWGVYLLSEQQEIKEGRINLTENKKNYSGNDIGYLLEYDGYAVNEEEKNRLFIDYTYGYFNKFYLKDINNKFITEFKNDYTIKSDINDISQKQFIEKYMNNLWKLCYEAAYKNNFYKFNENYELVEYDDPEITVEKCISEVIDIPSLVDSYIISEVACDPDLYWSSFYMDIDFGENGDKKLRFEAPWDFDSAFGNKRHCANGVGVWAGASQMDVDFNFNGCGNPWLIVFINCDWFQDLITKKWHSIKKQNILKKLTDNIDFVIESKEYQNAFFRNQRRWNNVGMPYIFGEELNSVSGNCKSQKQAAEYLKDWLERRFKSLNEIWK